MESNHRDQMITTHAHITYLTRARSGAVNVRPLTPNWDFIGARITVRQAEALLGRVHMQVKGNFPNPSVFGFIIGCQFSNFFLWFL